MTLHYEKHRNFTECPGVEFLWKGTVSEQFRANCPKLCKNCAFWQNFHTRKVGKILVFFAVLDKESHSDFLSLIWSPLYVIISQATKTQLKWGRLKKNKTKTSKKSSRVFLITLKGGGEWKCCLGELWLSNAFVIVKTTFSRYRSIKISLTCVYIRPDCRYKNCCLIGK